MLAITREEGFATWLLGVRLPGWRQAAAEFPRRPHGILPLCQIMSLLPRLVRVMMARPRSSRRVTSESKVTIVTRMPKCRVSTGWDEPRAHGRPVWLDLEIPADHEKFIPVRPGREFVGNSCCRTIDSCLRRLLDSVRKRLVPRDGHTGVTSRPGGRNWGWRHA